MSTTTATATLDRYYVGVQVPCTNCGHGKYELATAYSRYCRRVLGLPHTYFCDNCEHGIDFEAYRAIHVNMAWCETKEMADPEPEPYGQCLSCGAIEARLNKVIGFKDFSNIGESAEYPIGNGCEFCD